MRERLTLPGSRRLRRKADFESAYARGRRCGDAFFVVTARLNDSLGPRIGLAVSLKVAGDAIERNRLRRVIRESFRLAQHRLPPLDLVVSARPPARNAPAAELREHLESLWSTVSHQCASSPRS